MLGDLTIDIAQRRVTVAGQQVRLTAIQCDPLAELAVNAGRVVPTKLKPRWDVHLSGDDDQLGYAGESLSSVLGE